MNLFQSLFLAILLGSCLFLQITQIQAQKVDLVAKTKGLAQAEQKLLDSLSNVITVESDEQINEYTQMGLLTIRVYGALWCVYTTQVLPIMRQVAVSLVHDKEKIPILFINCVLESLASHCQKNQITKYPTIWMYKGEEQIGREFRGQRNVPSLVKWAEYISGPGVSEITSSQEFAELGHHKRVILGVFESKDDPNFRIFANLSDVYRYDCHFHVTFSPGMVGKDSSELPVILFKQKGVDERFKGTIKNLDTFVEDSCRPLVEEITFENAELLVEEGKPFVLLFHKHGDSKSIKDFTKMIKKEVGHEKHRVRFLFADASFFQHPMQHMGKTDKDLPLIAIDTFKHIYHYPHGFKDSSKLGSFIADAFSGKLHYDFHFQEDLKKSKKDYQKIETKFKREGDSPKDDDNDDDDDGFGDDVDNDFNDDDPPKKIKPADSVFTKLAPSKKKYSFGGKPRDEL